MARRLQDREALLREATALVPRVQLQIAEGEVFAGFREDSLSLYFNADPVYHFNACRELRRAFVDGSLLKAEHGRLVALRPRRGKDSTEMLSHELTAAELDQFRCSLAANVAELRDSLTCGNFALLGQVPTGTGALPRLMAWLEEFQDLRIAPSPRVGG